MRIPAHYFSGGKAEAALDETLLSRDVAFRTERSYPLK
jgi:hypothetical protein